MTPWVLRLLLANIGVFFLQMTSPGLTDRLVFVPREVLHHPWTIVTYMFIHGGWGHLFFNMLALYFFGTRVEARLGERRFLVLYFMSGLSGALLSLIFTPTAAILGASGAVFGVMFAFAYYWPHDRIYIWGVLPVPAWLLVAVTAAMAVVGGVSGMFGATGGVAHFAHLGGFAFAWLYMLWLERRQGARQFRKQSIAPVKRDSLANWKSVKTDSVHEINREEVNRILDKISASGLSSLTPQERLFLSNFVPPDDRTPPPS